MVLIILVVVLLVLYWYIVANLVVLTAVQRVRNTRAEKGVDNDVFTNGVWRAFKGFVYGGRLLHTGRLLIRTLRYMSSTATAYLEFSWIILLICVIYVHS